jgi:iron-sulfur cluster assembly protein
MNVMITPAAEEFMRRIIRFGGAEGSGFRLVVRKGGCSGLASEFSVESLPREDDVVFEHNGVKIFLPVESRLLLEGVTIDFTDAPTQSGLVFHDPKGGACSCGSRGIASVDVMNIARKH